MFKFYGDTSSGDGVMALGGYMAPPKAWDRFERKWQALLDRAGVTAFHATDFYNQRGEFKGWEKKREHKYAALFTEAAEHNSYGIVRAVDTKAFSNFCGKVLTSAAVTPHGLFTPRMYLLLQTLVGLSHLPGVEKTGIAVYVEEEQGMGEAIEYILWLKVKKKVDFLQIFVALGMVTKEVLPVQAADLLAHEGWRRAKELIHPTGRPRRRSLERLTVRQRVELKAAGEYELLSHTGLFLLWLDENKNLKRKPS